MMPLTDPDSPTAWASIGQRLRRARLERNLSQADFGDLCGHSAQFVSWVERGSKPIPVRMILAAHKHLGVSPDALLLDGGAA